MPHRQLESAPHEGRVVARRVEPVPARRPEPLLALQRSHGNRYVSRFVDGAAPAPPGIERAIDGARGGGNALPTPVRSRMESAFDADFGQVRVHTDSRADGLSRDLSARAFTTGSDIFFRQGAYAPETSGGGELLAHELTHVVQQTGGLRTKLTVNAPGDSYEHEADQVAREVVQRQSEDDEDVQMQPAPEEEEERPPVT
jgi:hypothetical protein